jgi:[FeFe] hydrogenase H-cluster maturation GTPase HydF
MLQVHCMREILDKNASAMIVKETELAAVLNKLKFLPKLVVCDSQVFDKVVNIVPNQVPTTTFSILMARFKSDFEVMLNGTAFIDALKPGDKVLIAESCTHHPVGDDIGRVQIPALLNEYVGGDVQIDITAGRDFPEDMSPYKLIIHCGACVFNRAEMLSRIAKAQAANIPISNYGMAIAFMKGILNRALEPLMPAREFIKKIA